MSGTSAKALRPEPTALPADRPSRPLLARAERRDSILSAAAVAFARAGFAATSMDDIARAAGITKLIVYRHFDSKEELYRGALEKVVNRLRDVFIAGLPSDQPSGIGVKAFLTVAREDPAGFALLWRHAAREAEFCECAHELRERAVGGVSVMLARVFEDRTIVTWLAETVVGFLVEATLNWLEWGDDGRDVEFEELTARALRSMLISMIPPGGATSPS